MQNCNFALHGSNCTKVHFHIELRGLAQILRRMWVGACLLKASELPEHLQQQQGLPSSHHLRQLPPHQAVACSLAVGDASCMACNAGRQAANEAC